ncbi:MAG TPA: S8 family serine peptidase [Kofleriaceae bacterium]|nr:S8 family serine peptidase [Kofleriaceae bacterium]
MPRLAAALLLAAAAAAPGCSTEPSQESERRAELAAGAEVVATRSDSRGARTYTRQKLRARDGSITSVAFDDRGHRVGDADIPAFTRELIGPRLRQALDAPAGADRAGEQLDVVLILRGEVEEAGDPEQRVEVELAGGSGPRFSVDGRPADEAAVRAMSEQLLGGVARRHAARELRHRARLQALAARHGWADDPELAAARQRPEESGGRLRRALTRAEITQLAGRSADLIEGIELYVAPRASTASALGSIGVDVWAHSQGVRGAGVGIYMSEAGGGCPVSPHIDSARYSKIGGGGETWHADFVGNVLRVTAPDAHIYCGPADSMISNPAAYSPRIHVTNHSWNYYVNDTSYWGQDRDFDDAVYNHRISVFVSAGNGDQVSNTNVLSPAKAFNAFAVGNYDDTTNAMAGSSRFVNPSAGHEKPEIVAPGTNLSSSAGSGSGTSFSSPFAAAFTADLLSQYTWLQGHPEVIKAMLMAGASRNIEGAALLSDKDGAGGISYLNTAYNGSMSWWSGANNSWFDANNKLTLTRSLGAGQRYRMALAWLVSGSYAFSNNNVSMDLDFWVTSPSGATVAGSYSYDNGFELVDFVAPVSGTYTITINRYWNSGVGDVVMAHHTQAVY